MKELGVFITTHIPTVKDGVHRHSPVMRSKLPMYFKYMLEKYINLRSGLESKDWDLFFMDTGSTHAESIELIQATVTASPNVHCVKIPNIGGGFASLKHVMHRMQGIKKTYSHFLFHIDDGVEPIKDDWATSILNDYLRDDDLKITGRLSETILLGPKGLPKHRNRCEHIGKMWSLANDKVIPHLHADWWMMNQETLMNLADFWYDPVCEDPRHMAYQYVWENIPYPILHEITDGHKTLDDVHIGREVDTPLRIGLFGGRTATYQGDSMYASQLHHRIGPQGDRPFKYEEIEND